MRPTQLWNYLMGRCFTVLYRHNHAFRRSVAKRRVLACKHFKSGRQCGHLSPNKPATCRRCGYTGPHSTAAECISALRDRLSMEQCGQFFPAQYRKVFDESDIWLLDVARGVPSRFTFRTGISADGVWSPDGTRLVSEADNTALYVKSVSGARWVGSPSDSQQLFVGCLSVAKGLQ
jgi:hypothetical protein